MDSLQRIRRSARGQALVEFVIVSQVVIVLLFAIVQFGIVWMNDITITDAAREGARQAIVQRSAGQAAVITAGQTAAFAAAANLNKNNLTVNVTAVAGTWNQGDPIAVSVQYPYTISLLGIPLKSGMLTATTTMRAE